MNPFDPDIFAADIGCLPCCNQPSECACALLIPPADDFVTSPYADYATAAAAIAAQVASCIGFIRKQTGGTITAFTADDSVADELTLSATGNPDNAPSCQAFMWASLNMKAGSTLTVVSTAGGGLAPGSGGGFLYDCAGVLVDELHGSSVGFSIPADGAYIFLATITSLTSGFPFGSDTMTSVATSDDTMTVNPVIALWDDSGTTRKLWACPKLLLPPLTESTGDWYADCAAADAVLTDAAQVSNCVGCYGGGTGNAPDAFTATDGGTSLSFSGTWGSPTAGFGDCYGGVNAEAGETLSFAFTGGTQAEADIYDDTGTLIESLGPSGSTLVSSALPYTGRYTFRVRTFVSIMDPPFTAASMTATSSGTLSVNPIQARYDIGLDCAGTLDCGDACP